MKHSLKISYTKEPGYGGIVWCRTVPLRERLLRRLFGEMRWVTIIVPGGSVEELSVKEIAEVGFHGIIKKIVIFCLVAVGHIIDTHIIQNGSVLRTAVIFFYLSNDGISILENAARIGIPVPEKLKAVLEQLQKKD